MLNGYMKAAVIHEYGDATIFKHEDIAIPEPGADEVLVKVHYASVNPFDYKVRAGYMKDSMPLKFPAILGTDMVGTVEKAGLSALKFKKGDLVFGKANFGSNGSYAEYALAKESNISHAPKNMPEREAAGLPVAAGTAWTVLVELAGLRKGQKIMITGASGGVGIMAIQIAKNIGTHVTGTASKSNLQTINEMGADEAIDYTEGDFSEKVKDVDVLLDTVGGETLSKTYKMVKRGGKLISLTGPTDKASADKYGIDAQYLSVPSDGKTMEELAKLADSGKLKVIIDREFPLEKISEAHVLSESRKAKGKIIIKIQS